MPTLDPSPSQPHDWMTPVITFTLIPATMHLGLLVWLLNHDHLPLWADALLQLLLIGGDVPRGLVTVAVMTFIYFTALIELCRRADRPAPMIQFALGLIYPAPIMAAATILAFLGRVF